MITLVPLAACGQLIGTLELEVLTPEPNPPVATSDPGTGGGPPERGMVSGAICFPSEFIPEMSVYFQNVDTGEFRELAIAQNQSTFLTELPPGTYIAFAYPDGLPIGGAYTEAVLCGLRADCADHRLREFPVRVGDETSGINICDWYAPSNIPPHPGAGEVLDQTNEGMDPPFVALKRPVVGGMPSLDRPPDRSTKKS